jgi:putative PIN family toxin of toxin-antitoxin system
MATLRVVLDTNVMVSGLAYPAGIPGRIVGASQQGSVTLALSRYILNEVTRVLPRLTRVKLTPAEIADLADSLLFRAEIVEPIPEREDALRDEADQSVLGTLRAAQADYLITGDKDLLALAELYPILTPAAFWARHA